jgi:hypothetical protein
MACLRSDHDQTRAGETVSALWDSGCTGGMAGCVCARVHVDVLGGGRGTGAFQKESLVEREHPVMNGAQRAG